MLVAHGITRVVEKLSPGAPLQGVLILIVLGCGPGAGLFLSSQGDFNIHPHFIFFSKIF